MMSGHRLENSADQELLLIEDMHEAIISGTRRISGGFATILCHLLSRATGQALFCFIHKINLNGRVSTSFNQKYLKLFRMI